MKIYLISSGILHLTYSFPLVSFSLEECGRYLETIKVYENKPADIIREQTDTDYMSRVNYPYVHIILIFKIATNFCSRSK
jgi:hypothetical protein